MIKVFCVNFEQGNIAPLVFVVALIADLLFLMLSMQAMLGDFILCNFLVAALAQAGLGGLVKALVTTRAIVFEFGMEFYYRTGH